MTWIFGFFSGLIWGTFEDFFRKSHLKKEDKLEEETRDPDKTLKHYLVTNITLFIVSIAAVYKASDVSHDWFLGYISDSKITIIYHLLFGFCSGLFLVILIQYVLWPTIRTLKYIPRASQNIAFKYWAYLNLEISKILIKFNFLKSDNSLNDLEFIAGFDPEENIKYLEGFLKQVPNEADKRTLAFWKARKESMKQGTLNYRVTLKGSKATELLNREITSLPIEFWKTKNNAFEFRTIEPTNSTYKEPTARDAGILLPYIIRWYEVLSK